MKTILIATTALALSFGTAHAFGGKGGDGGDATAVAGAAAAASAGASASNDVRIKNRNSNYNSNRNHNSNRNYNTAKQGQAQGQLQGQQQSVNNSDSVVINEAEIPRFTGSASVVFSSMVNDSCGRVAFGVPYSAHTCNVLLEAAALADTIAPVFGERKAYIAGIRHLAENDRTMRNTLVRSGIVKRK